MHSRNIFYQLFITAFLPIFVFACADSQAKLPFKIEEIKSKDSNGRTLVHHAVLSKDLNRLKLLVENGAEITAADRYKYTPLHYAAKFGSLDICRFLIHHKADLDAANNYLRTPLHLAAIKGDKKTIVLLIASGADFKARDKDNKIPGELALKETLPEIIEILFPVHKAVRENDQEKVNFLLNQFPDLINHQENQGRTPLHIAFIYNRPDIAKLLLSKGADLQIKDKFSKLPDFYSLENKMKKTGINMLLQSTADLVDQKALSMLKQYSQINIALVRKNKIIFSRNYGSGNLTDDKAWGSVSKPVTAMLIMHLQHTGKIRSIDDPIWDYSSKFRNCMPVKYKEFPLTIRHLLIHVSGVPHNQEPTWKKGKLNLKFKPGSRDMYSTPGYGLLGQIIESITSMSYSQAVKDFIGKPADADSFWAEKHFRAPGARVHSTVEDMARFALGVLNHIYLPEDTFYNQMLKYQNGPAVIGWGMMYANSPDMTIFHGGSNGYPQAYLSIKPKKGIAVAILATAKNRNMFKLGSLAAPIMDILTKPVHSDTQKSGSKNEKVLD